MYQLEEYLTEDGQRPFGNWLLGIKDTQTKLRLRMRLSRVELGNLGDWKVLQNTDGVCELREHFGAGWRIYFAFEGDKVILLLAGSDKSDQQRIIKKAAHYLQDYRRRKHVQLTKH